MGKETGISWTDHTFNPWWGCMKVSPGCANCYAEAFAKRTGHNVWGPTAEYRTFGVKHWNEPLKWEGRVFCASMADVFDERGPESERRKLWDLIDKTPFLTWQLLTKRPENILKYAPTRFPAVNVWLGATTENQEMYEARAMHLAEASIQLGTAAFVSYEPAIGPLTFASFPSWQPDWLICGGESGGKRRPMQQAWAENIKRECGERGTKFFMKQMSAQTPAKGKALIPAHLLIQQFPDPAGAL